jgi:hypothetical protein
MAKRHERAYYSKATTVEEKKTSLTQAIENYRKFLSLWGNADPIFGEVEEAKKRLFALESK